MLSILLRQVGVLQQTDVLSQPPPMCVTYVELMAGVYLVASVNSMKNQCTVELLFDSASASPAAASSKMRSTKTAASAVTEKDYADEVFLESLRRSFRVPKVFELIEEEGTITAIEFARDYRKMMSSKETPTQRKGSLESVYVHLFIGTCNGTIFICNALRGTIMALTQFQYHDIVGHSFLGREKEEKRNTNKVNEGIVRFVLLGTGPDARLNANITQSIGSLAADNLHAVCIVHSRGRTVLLSRAVLDVFISTAEQRLDGKRPYLVVDWSPNSTISSFPAAGPAAHFASYMESVFIASKEKMYSTVELQTQSPSSTDLEERTINDAAFFFGNCHDTTTILRNGPKAMEFLLLGGRAPALSIYTFENTHSAFSARWAVNAVVSALSGVTRFMWAGRSSKSADKGANKPKILTKKHQQAKDSFLEADMMFNSVKVDPTSQWAACYSKNAGRIYLYDLMGGTIWRVMKGCRAAEFQWCMATIAGKRMLLLVVHLLLRHAVEIYSLRLGCRLAARHVPRGSTLLRLESLSSLLSVFLLTPSRHVMQMQLKLNLGEEERLSSAVLGSSSSSAASLQGAKQGSTSRRGEKKYQMMPRDILETALSLPLPVPATDMQCFATYESQMKELMNNVKQNFSPGVSDDRCLSVSVATTIENIPDNITAAQCLNYLELRLACVEKYRMALMVREGNGGKVPRLDMMKGLEFPSEEESRFFENAQPHPSLVRAVQVVSEMLSTVNDSSDNANACKDILPSILQLLQRHDECSSLKDVITEISPISLDEFSEIFDYGGYKLEFLRDKVLGYENVCDTTKEEEEDIWARIGAVFYTSRGCGLGSLMQQFDVFRALGFQITDVSIISFSWLCRSFAHSPTSLSLGLLSNLVFFLKTCNDEAFLTGIEHIPFLTTKTNNNNNNQGDSEACLLLMILCMIIRQENKPVGEGYYSRYVRLLRQLLAVRVMLNHSKDQINLYFISCGEKREKYEKERCTRLLRMCNLFQSKGGEALNAYFFEFFPPNLASVLSENITGNENLTNALGGVDIVKLLNILFFFTRKNPEWNAETPWYSNRIWNHAAFSDHALKPLKTITGNVKSKILEKGEYFIQAATLQQLAGLCVILVLQLFLLEKELEPLREEPLAFLQNNTAPDANLFEGSGDLEGEEVEEEKKKNLARRPRGSRSTRDYFNSCHELLGLTRGLMIRLVGGKTNNPDESGRVVDAIYQLLSYDDNALFSLIPRRIRQDLQSLMDLFRVNPYPLLERLYEVSSFVDTVMFFAFREAGMSLSSFPDSSSSAAVASSSSSSSSPSVSLSIPWGSMFGVKENMLHLLSSLKCTDSTGNQLLENQMEKRSSLLRRFTFVNFRSSHPRACSERVTLLGEALGLTRFVCDISQLVLFDAAAWHLSPNAELNHLLNAVKSRQLAARIAAEDFRILLASCFKYFAELKRGIPQDNRLELQRIALKIKSMESLMSEECRSWIKMGNVKSDGDMERKKKEPLTLSWERRLIMCPSWYMSHDLCAVDARVKERLQQPRGSEELREFNAILFTLARAAAEGKSVLKGNAQLVAAEFPTIASRLSTLF